MEERPGGLQHGCPLCVFLPLFCNVSQGGSVLGTKLPAKFQRQQPSRQYLSKLSGCQNHHPRQTGKQPSASLEVPVCYPLFPVLSLGTPARDLLLVNPQHLSDLPQPVNSSHPLFWSGERCSAVSVFLGHLSEPQDKPGIHSMFLSTAYQGAL